MAIHQPFDKLRERGLDKLRERGLDKLKERGLDKLKERGLDKPREQEKAEFRPWMGIRGLSSRFSMEKVIGWLFCRCRIRAPHLLRTPESAIRGATTYHRK